MAGAAVLAEKMKDHEALKGLLFGAALVGLAVSGFDAGNYDIENRINSGVVTESVLAVSPKKCARGLKTRWYPPSHYACLISGCLPS